MNRGFMFEAEPFDVGTKGEKASWSGPWFRRGRNIVVLLPNNKSVPYDSQVYEVTAGDFRSPNLLLRRGSRGEAVAYLQRLLNTWIARSRLPMAPLKEDGTFGLATEGRVRSFQRATRLPADGIVGPQTRGRLLNLVGVPITQGLKRVGGGTTVIPECAGIGQPCEVLEKFGFDSDSVTVDHLQQIDRIARCVVASQNTSAPILSMLVVGHTSPEGSDQYNFDLGMRRAQKVIQKLKEAIRDLTQGTNLADLADRIVFTLDSGGEKQPIADNSSEEGRAQNRRVEVCLPPLPNRPPPPTPELKCEDVATRSLALLETAPFPNEQKNRLRCVLAMVCDLSVDDHYINGKDFIVRTLAKGIFPRLDPAAFARAVIKDRVRRDLIVAAQGSDDTLRDSLKLLDERILSGINLISDQAQRNSELNVNNPVLRQMQEFVSAQQRNQRSIYFCYGLGQK